jgi:hypothetical protein
MAWPSLAPQPRKSFLAVFGKAQILCYGDLRVMRCTKGTYRFFLFNYMALFFVSLALPNDFQSEYFQALQMLILFYNFMILD